MGTRNLTMVIHNHEPKIAQYGQWDGYPDGQGSTVLEFLQGVNYEKFKEVLSRCRFLESSKRKQKEIQNFLTKIGAADGWMNMEQAAQYKTKFPYLTRDLGAGILSLLYESEGNDLLWIHDRSDFAADSLFCEWAYVIDLDKMTLEVYTGFNKTPLERGDRFYEMQEKNQHYVQRRGDDQYYPIKILKSYDLNNLPDVDTFVDELNKLDEQNQETENAE